MHFFNVIAQGSLDWSVTSTEQVTMTVSVPDDAIDQIFIDNSTFPIGGVIGAFYQNEDDEYKCLGSVIWDFQANVIPVWSTDDLSENQEIILFAMYGGVTYIQESSPDLYISNDANFVIESANFIYYLSSDEVVGCLDPSACNYDFYATVENNSSCTYPVLDYLNCDGSCESDIDSDGVCDINEVLGCMDDLAYNYSPLATENFGCLYPGCMDVNALNFDPNANNPDNSCQYPVYELDWSFDNTDQDATIAISNITGLPTNNFNDFVVGVFYDNSFASDSTYSGISCASTYNASSSFAQMTVYADEVYTSEKDGFELQEELKYIVLHDGQEYYAEASYMQSQEASWGMFDLVSENIFIPYSLYIVEQLNVIGPVSFGCTDSNFVEFSLDANLDDGSCSIAVVEGCMDVVASNYDSDANTEDGSCLYPGCTDDNFIEYWNYDPVLSSISTPSIVANLDDGSCLTPVLTGCTDVSAFNFDELSNVNDGSCIDVVEGCTDDTMFNYDSLANTDYEGALCIPYIYGCTNYSAYNYYAFANTDDGSCYFAPGCTNPSALNFNPDADYDDDSCIEIVDGCTIETMWNFNENANVNDGSCIPYIYGCTDSSMWNYNSEANTDDDSCIPFAYGCTDPTAFNYDSAANTDDGSCVSYIFGCLDSDGV